jgi:hypothetical protein
MKGNAIPYSEPELKFIKDHKSMPRRDLHAEFVKAFNRTDVSLNNLKALCKRKGWLTGRDGQYTKGSIPANKGKSMPFNPNSARTQFKKGNKPHNINFLGHERVSKDGYVEISIDETNPHTGFERRYVLKHRHVWEKANGPIPDGMLLKCLDGDKTNMSLENWKLIPRAMLPNLNWRDYDNSPEEVKPAIMKIAEIKHTVSKYRKSQTQS